MTERIRVRARTNAGPGLLQKLRFLVFYAAAAWRLRRLRFDVVQDAARGAPGVVEASVRVTYVTDRLSWLTVTAYAPLDADVGSIGSELRERGLTALQDGGLLPV